jgi:succinate dehydrogenase/fumarate reductase flavoprotein subunit
VGLGLADPVTPHVVVIGGGGAALRACLAAAERGARVTIVSKGRAGASGCTHAIDSKIEFSVVNSPRPAPDTPSAYVADLEAVGQRLKSPDRLHLFAERSIAELQLLERLGVPLADARGYRRIQLAGSSHSRGIICPSRFGTRVLQALWTATPRDHVDVREGAMALDILTADGRATGVVVTDLATGALSVIPADAVVLAAGGAGQVFPLTTNPRELSGDGYALAARAGARLDHMEFIQYVMLTVAPIRGYFLLSSVLLRGRLVDEDGAGFVPDADPARLGPVAQKQLLAEFMGWIAARKRGRPGVRVFWDGTALGPGLFNRTMPRTYAAFFRRGHDLARQPVEIALGAHQFLGGVVTDLTARSTVPNLFAAGDVADSVQGADRINGSGIMEALVFGALAGAEAAASPVLGTRPELPPAYRQRRAHDQERFAGRRRELARAMDEILVVRERSRLEGLATLLGGYAADLEAGGLRAETPGALRGLHELRSAVATCREVVRASLERGSDLGLFVTSATA